MSGPLRIRGAPTGPMVGGYAGPVDPWLTRLVKLVPSEVVAVYLRSDGSVAGAASTVIDLTGTEPRVLRRGDVDPEHVIGLATAR